MEWISQKKTNFKLFNINKNFRFFRRKTTIKYVIVGGYESKAFLPANFPQKHKLHLTFFRTRITNMRFVLSTSIQNFYKRTTLKQHSTTFRQVLTRFHQEFRTSRYQKLQTTRVFEEHHNLADWNVLNAGYTPYLIANKLNLQHIIVDL